MRECCARLTHKLDAFSHSILRGKKSGCNIYGIKDQWVLRNAATDDKEVGTTASDFKLNKGIGKTAMDFEPIDKGVGNTPKDLKSNYKGVRNTTRDVIATPLLLVVPCSM